MTFDGLREWMKQGSAIMKMMTGAEKEDTRTVEEKIRDAGANAGIKPPRMF